MGCCELRDVPTTATQASERSVPATRATRKAARVEEACVPPTAHWQSASTLFPAPDACALHTFEYR
jgi:hypothetical protein